MFTVDDFARQSDVSRETLESYKLWHSLLLKWNRRINLVSHTAIEDYWARHALDSWQITPYLPESVEKIIDLGSGAGFPGLSLAISCKERAQGSVLLVESAGKKASFLRTVIRELDLPAKVISDRAETLPAEIYDVVSARAFAPLPRLFDYAQRFWGKNTQGLFLKGENVQYELTEAKKTWNYDVDIKPSVSDSTGSILKVTGLARLNT